MRDRRRQASERRQLDLLRFGLCAAEVFEVDQCAAVQSGTDAHESYAQEPLRRLDLERRQRLRTVFVPAAPVIMQRRRKFDESHTAAHSTEVAEKPRDLRVMAAHDTVQVDDEHAVLHVLNDETVYLLQIG